MTNPEPTTEYDETAIHLLEAAAWRIERAETDRQAWDAYCEVRHLFDSYNLDQLASARRVLRAFTEWQAAHPVEMHPLVEFR